MGTTSIPLGSVPASKVRIVMHEAHSTAGSFQGRAVFGIRTLSLYARRLSSTVEDCAIAAKSADARDKYFQTYVREFGPCSSKSLRSELPSLEAARASVAAVLSELVDVLPKLNSCRGAVSLMRVRAGHAHWAMGAQSRSPLPSQVAQNVEKQN